MTAQVPDQVTYCNDKYRIIGVKGLRLLTPQNFGMTPAMMSTGCYRGYFTEYACINKLFVLTRMTVRTIDGVYPPVHDVAVQIGGAYQAGQYFGLRVPVPFTGALLLGKDFIGSMYVHMGFQKPTSFGTVVQLVMDNGRIVAETDFSQKIAALREGTASQAVKPGTSANSDDISKWVEWMFSLDYDLDL